MEFMGHHEIDEYKQHGNIRKRRQEKKKQMETLFKEIIAKIFPIMRRDIDIQVQEVQEFPIRFDPKKNLPTHIIIKLWKIKFKQRILKGAEK